MPDEFLTAASPSGKKTYDPEEFYVASTNSKGFGSSFRIKVPPEVIGEIGALVAARVIPLYRTPADFHRDAMVHRLHQVHDLLKDDATMRSDILRRLSEKLAAESFAAHVQQMIEADKRLFDQAIQLVQESPEHSRPKALEAAKAILNVIDDLDLRERLSERLARYT